MFEKLKPYQEKIESYVDQLQDVRVIGLVTLATMVLLISWSGVKAINMNYTLQKQISRLQQQNNVQGLTNTNLKLQNEYFTTDRYLELAARQTFGLAQPGETVLLVPQSVALAHTSNIQNAEDVQTKQTSERQPTYQKNFQAWMNFFLHRQSTVN